MLTGPQTQCSHVADSVLTGPQTQCSHVRRQWCSHIADSVLTGHRLGAHTSTDSDAHTSTDSVLTGPQTRCSQVRRLSAHTSADSDACRGTPLGRGQPLPQVSPCCSGLRGLRGTEMGSLSPPVTSRTAEAHLPPTPHPTVTASPYHSLTQMLRHTSLCPLRLRQGWDQAPPVQTQPQLLSVQETPCSLQPGVPQGPVPPRLPPLEASRGGFSELSGLMHFLRS